MTAEKVQIKLYATDRTDAPLEGYIPVFHRFIRDGVFDELMIDVADYTHVPRGIGVLLVGHASDYAIDEGEGRPGLLYSRKRALPEGAKLVTDGLGRALFAAKLLDGDESLEGPSGFGTDEILFRFLDRLHLQNDDASFDKVRGDVVAALAEHLPGAEFSLTREGEPREALTIRAQRS